MQAVLTDPVLLLSRAQFQTLLMLELYCNFHFHLFSGSVHRLCLSVRQRANLSFEIEIHRGTELQNVDVSEGKYVKIDVALQRTLQRNSYVTLVRCLGNMSVDLAFNVPVSSMQIL